MRILVTGGAGFIGSHIVDGFVADGHDVLVLDDLSTGKREYVHEKAELAVIDLQDCSSVESLVASYRPMLVNHHAAQIDVRESVSNPVLDARINVLGSVNLLSAASRHGVRGVIFASSGGTVYGETPKPAKETHTKAPISPYAAAKHSVEGYLLSFSASRLRAVSLRYGNVYGPRQDPRGEAGVISIFAGAMLQRDVPTIFGGGEAVRDYIMVPDVVTANRLAVDHVLASTGTPRTIDELAFNIGTGISTSVSDLYELIAEECGFHSSAIRGPGRAGELQQSRLDVSRARAELGFEAQVPLSEGVRETVAHIRSGASR